MFASFGGHTMLANIPFQSKNRELQLSFGSPDLSGQLLSKNINLPTPIFTLDAATLTLHALNVLKRAKHIVFYLFTNFLKVQT